MKLYEIMTIVSNEVGDNKQAEAFIKEFVIGRISSQGGSITFEDFWGERGFAYKINKQTWGYYFVAQFQIEADEINTLKREWNLDSKVVRFLITIVPKGQENPKKYAEMKKEDEAQEKKLEKEKEVTNKPHPGRREKLTTIPKNEDTNTVDNKTDQVNTPDKTDEKKPKESTLSEKKGDVDKKLDAILEDSSLNL